MPQPPALPAPTRRIARTSAGGSRLHRPRLRRLQRALDHGRWRPGPPRPTEAIGVYIGGDNRACSQPNLTPSWVSAQTAAGWHLIPTYVGLQAPTCSCSSCAKLSASQATAQGVAAADDAVEEAAASAIGPGSPIYFDMESYSPTPAPPPPSSPSSKPGPRAARARLPLRGLQQQRLRHRRPRRRGRQRLPEPDDIWIANWNGQQNTRPLGAGHRLDRHQRIHQYRGGHNETYGGVTINIDNDYVDGATVGVGDAAGR